MPSGAKQRKNHDKNIVVNIQSIYAYLGRKREKSAGKNKNVIVFIRIVPETCILRF